jgi:hypothetical protein
MQKSRRAASLTAAAALAVLGAFACEKAGSAHEATAKQPPRDTVPQATGGVPARCATMPASWTAAVTPARLLPGAPGDTSAARPDSGAQRDSGSARRDSVKARRDSIATARRDSIATRRLATDTFPTPPTPLPGAVLPGCRIVAYYGNSLSTRMGILGELPVPQMLARLEAEAHAFERADTTMPVVRALEMITPVAQGSPGPKGLWRTRMNDTLIENMAKLAESKGYLFIIDVQVGKSTVAAELEPLLPWLRRPYVHLALDPEFSMKGKEPPGKKIGTLDATDINVAVAQLIKLVDENKLPPKILIVHRFTRSMLTNHEKITRDPRVQVIIDMDGFGPPHLKLDSYKAYVQQRPVQYFGIKLFYKNDKPRFTAEDVMQLSPIPQYIQFQ